MSKELLSRKKENTIRITAEFLEDGYLLKSGRSSVHRYDLDLLVRDDITLDALLGAVYAGIREVLEKRYRLELKNNLAGIVYQDFQDPFAFRAADGLRGSRRLRPSVGRRLRMRVDAMRYRNQRRKLADMEERYPMFPDEAAGMSAEQKERLGWIVCWQVFHECFRAYAGGYPDKVGEAESNEIRTEEYLCHPVIARSSVDLQADDNGAYYGTARRPQLQLVQSRDGKKTLRELGFLTTTRLIFDPVLWHYSAALFDQRKMEPYVGDQLPYYSFEKHSQTEPDKEEVSILPLEKPPARPNIRNTPLILLSPLIMLGVILALLGFSGELRAQNMLQNFGIMVTATLLAGVLGWLLHWAGYQISLRVWLRPYEREIRQTLRDLVERQERDSAMMQQMHPPVYTPDRKTDLIHQLLEFSGDACHACPGDWDFLRVRLGLSAEGSRLVSSVFPVTGVPGEGAFSTIRYKNLRGRKPETFKLLLAGWNSKKKDSDPYCGKLTELPADLAREYGHLIHAPVLLDMQNTCAIGVVFQDQKMKFDPLLENLVLDLCSHHAPEDLQFVMLCPAEQDWKARHDKIRKFKHLPHFDELLKDRSAFAFGRNEAWALFDQLQILQNCRNAGQHLPHIVVLVEEEYDLRDHPLAGVLPASLEQAYTDTGITFVFCKRAERELPPWCANVLMVDQERHWYLLPCRQQAEHHADYRDRSSWARYRLEPDPMIDRPDYAEQKPAADLLFRAFKTISAVRYSKQDWNRVPARLDLFPLLTDPDEMPLCYAQSEAEKRQHLGQLRKMLRSAIAENWAMGCEDTLEVPIGKGETGLVWLDLHEQQAGPHLLIAGDGRTGKTAAALTYFHVLGILYSPQAVSVIPVDLHDRGLARALKQLPHTRKDLLLEGGSRMDAAAYLRRLLRWLEDEMLRRRQQFSRMGVTGIDAYNRSAADTMQRIFVAFDDFDDLVHIAADQIDLTAEVTRLLRSGRELGVHIVLITDRLEPSIPGQLLEQIRARICLRLPDAEEAKQIMYTDAPAREHMPGDGRAYLRGSVGTMAEYIQMAYGGADIGGTTYAPFQVVLAEAGGAYRCFFDSQTYHPPGDEESDAWAEAVHEPIRYDRTVGKERKRRKLVNGNGSGGDERNDEQQGQSQYGDVRASQSHGRQNHGDVRNETRHTQSGEWIPAEEIPAQKWKDNRNGGEPNSGFERRPCDAAPNDADWRERYFRRWRAHPYNHVPPVDQEDPEPVSAEWVRPDQALLPTVSFGISQQEFIARVMHDYIQRSGFPVNTTS